MRFRKPGRPRVSTTTKASRKRSRYRKNRSDGRCGYCKDPVLPGFKLCAYHREMNVAAQRRRMETVRASGQCRECRGPATRGTRCLTCRLKRKERLSRQPGYRSRYEYPFAGKRPALDAVAVSAR